MHNNAICCILCLPPQGQASSPIPILLYILGVLSYTSLLLGWFSLSPLWA